MGWHRKRNVSDAAKLRKQVATLARFGGEALRSSEIGDLLQEATQLVSDAVEVDLVKVLELLPDGQTFLVRSGVNWNAGVVGHATIPADGGSAAGHALWTDAAVISDIATETRFTTPRLLIEHGVKSTVNVVIRGEGAPFGVLEVDSRERRAFGQDDINFLQNYGNLLASAIDRVRKQSELEASIEKQQVLMHELHHRVNNMLMTIRAVARLTRTKSTNLNEFAKALDDRLTALARSHARLNEANGSSISIREIISEELSARGAVEGENLIQKGPEIMVPSKQAQILSMAFHELATNAVKHGALSVEGGSIDVIWDAEQTQQTEHVRIRWREHGVAIECDPVRRGYGSEVLDKSIPDMPDGRFDRRFHREGVECVLEFSIEN